VEDSRKIIHKWSKKTLHGNTYREKVRYGVFLRDVWKLALFSFGGPQAHISMFLDVLVHRHKYITQSELIELHSLCQILPGPTSTQTLTAIAFKIGGPRLAFITLAIWILPAVTFMILAGIFFSYLDARSFSLGFTRFIQPIAVGFVAHSAFVMSSRVIKSNRGLALMIIGAAVSFLLPNPFLPPILLLGGGLLTALNYKTIEREEHKAPFVIEWANFILYISILIGAALIGYFTQNLPIRLFENFYRNGSLIFGGGQILIPLLYNEFVVFKNYLNSQEFLSGYALAQGLPGPVFAFSGFIGVLSMRGHGLAGAILGGSMASLGIFLPGTLLIFFVIRFWNNLKQFRVVRASLEGINAVGCGLLVSAALLLFEPLDTNMVNVLCISSTFIMLYFTKVKSYWLIAIGLLAGIIFP
jgi:chromate transporter